MTQGISNSLNSVLARMNYIEQNFASLAGLNGINQQQNTITNDFTKVLDEKITQAKPSEEKENKNLLGKIELNLENKTTEIENDDIFANLKSKIETNKNKDIDEIISMFSEKYEFVLKPKILKNNAAI